MSENSKKLLLESDIFNRLALKILFAKVLNIEKRQIFTMEKLEPEHLIIKAEKNKLNNH